MKTNWKTKLFLRKGESYPMEKLFKVRPNVNPCFLCGNPVIYNPKIEINDYTFRVIGFTMRTSTDKMHDCSDGYKE